MNTAEYEKHKASMRAWYHKHRARQLAYLRAYRKRAGKRCACGQPSIRVKWGAPVCARCDEIEHAREQNELRRLHAGFEGGLGAYALRLPHGLTI